MTFAHPALLAAGAIVTALFAAAIAAALRRGPAAAVTFSDLAFVVAATGARGDPARAIGAAAVLAVALGAVAIGGPRATLPVAVHGVIVICVDTSGSMRATDVEPTRWAAAARAVRAFVDAAPAGTEIGLVAFATTAAVIAAPTADRDDLRDAIARVPAPNGGTAIGDALAAAAAQLPDTGRRSIVLITDGVNNAGADPLPVAARAAAAGIDIDTIGIGTNDSGQLIPGTGESAALDEDALRAIASEGHGEFARVDDAGGLRAHLASLAQSTTHEARRVDLSLIFAALGIVVLAAAVGAGMLAGRFP